MGIQFASTQVNSFSKQAVRVSMILYETFGEHLRESLYTVHSEVPNSHEARLDELAAKVITITPRRRRQNIMELLSFISVAGNRSILFWKK